VGNYTTGAKLKSQKPISLLPDSVGLLAAAS